MGNYTPVLRTQEGIREQHHQLCLQAAEGFTEEGRLPEGLFYLPEA